SGELLNNQNLRDQILLSPVLQGLVQENYLQMAFAHDGPAKTLAELAVSQDGSSGRHPKFPRDRYLQTADLDLFSRGRFRQFSLAEKRSYYIEQIMTVVRSDRLGEMLSNPVAAVVRECLEEKLATDGSFSYSFIARDDQLGRQVDGKLPGSWER